ncbi:geranylgeranyl reductase family [Halovenus aranensis]|jgi:geranylgeranyl reductase family protein|uniref:Geranylgeranyl reductase family n=1 Tax=Halovenus aranensis TaxID=890420 RepID=A0A1G8UEI6_9EURY|nr:geranylgeranyl reductase family protein [Halovenus aranensis]SDJ51575.1 geranylgeranyl reductase family [Halovenus aranensis]
MHDFVVVGAGPAGSRFARGAAQAGYDVVAFEQGEVGKPLACSGHVSTDIWEFVPEAAHDRLFQNEIYGARFHTGGPDSQPYQFYKDEVVSNVIDRVELDRQLAKAAREAGAAVHENHTVVDIAEYRDYVDVTVRGPDGTETHRARMVAGCDGPKSRVRHAVGLPEPDELLHGVLGFDEEPDHEEFVDVHLTVPRFFAWRIPRGDAGVEYGLAMPPSNNVSARFEEFTDNYGAETDRRCSGLIPIGPAKTVTTGRVFLIGDAAAHNKPFTGGGILYGMTAADCAVETIDPTEPETLDAYESAWRSELLGDIQLGHLIRKGYSAPETIQETGMGLFEGEIGVHMDRPTTLFSADQFRAMLPR